MALLALGQESVVELEFTVDESTYTNPHVLTRKTYAIAGFRRFQGRNAPWKLSFPFPGEEGTPERPTKLYYYPHVQQGHAEIEDGKESELVQIA